MHQEAPVVAGAVFNKQYPLKKVAERAEKLGLFLPDGSQYNKENENLNALRMGFASMNNRELDRLWNCCKKQQWALHKKAGAEAPAV